MRVKGMDGQEYHVTGQGQGNYNTVGASAGIASFLGLNAGNILGGWGNRCGCGGNGADGAISRYEAGMMNELAGKDSKIALLEAQIYTDQQTDKKVGEAIAFVRGEMKELANELRGFEKEQCAVNREQAVYNGVNTATIQCMQGQIQTLLGITKVVIPNSSICPGWGNVTVTPATAPATGA